MKSVCDCLNFIDCVILCDIAKRGAVGNLEDVREYMITIFKDKYIGDMESTLGVFSQINLMIDRFYLDNESDFKKQYTTLRKCILSWLQERNTIPQVDNDE